MTCLPAAAAARRGPSVVVLAVLALAHAGLGISQGLEDGDYSLLWFDAFFIVPTFAAAGLCLLRHSAAVAVALALTILLLALAVVTTPLYLLGLFHLPQAVVACVVTARLSIR